MPGVRSAKLLRRIGPERELLRRCLERAQEAFGRRLPAAEVIDAVEDADLGIIWRHRSHEVCLCVQGNELWVRRCVYTANGGRALSPESDLKQPEELVELIGWLFEPPDPYIY